MYPNCILDNFVKFLSLNSRISTMNTESIRYYLKRIIFIFPIVCTLIICNPAISASKKNPVVLDSGSGLPLPRVSIFDRQGRLIAVADDEGRLPALSGTSFPLTLRSLGFKDKTIRDLKDTIINMDAALYALPELQVNTGRRPVLHMIGFIREISTMNSFPDTITLYREKWVDFMIPMGKERKYKGWSIPRVLKSKSYYKFSNADGLDSVSDRSDHHFSWSDWISLPKRYNLPPTIAGLRDGRDTIMGKYSPSQIWARTDDDVAVRINALADTAALKWAPRIARFFDDNTEFQSLILDFDYSEVDTFAVKPHNLQRMALYVETKGRGHDMFRFTNRDAPFYVTTYTDLHIVSRENIKVSDARRMEKDPALALDMAIIPLAFGLRTDEAGITELIERVNSIDHDVRRLGMQIDRSVASMRMPDAPAYTRKDKARQTMKKVIKTLGYRTR